METSVTERFSNLVYALLIGAEVLVLLDQHDRRTGGPGLEKRLRSWQKKYVKPWHFPERWRRMVNEVVVEAWIATEEDNEDD